MRVLTCGPSPGLRYADSTQWNTWTTPFTPPGDPATAPLAGRPQ